MKNIQAGKFFRQAFAYTIKSITVKPTGIGYETDDALLADAFTCPTDGADIAVIQVFLQGGFGMGGIGFGNLAIQMRIGNVFVTVIFTFLPCRVRRIADNHLNIQFFLAFTARAVIHQQLVQYIAFFIHLKRIGQTNAVKGNILAALCSFTVDIAVQQAVVSGFNINRGNVIGKQNNFVGMNFVTVFFRQLFRRNNAALQQPCNECTCACKWVNDVDVFIFQAA